MYLREYAETAALSVVNAEVIIRGNGLLPNINLQEYWQNARHRLTGWRRRLDRCSDWTRGFLPEESQVHWDRALRVLQEVFVSEILTRVWAGVLTAADRQRGVSHAEPIARSVFVSHLQLRRRALEFMLDCPDSSLTEIARIDRVRRRCERWNDMFLGPLLAEHPVAEFCFEPDRSDPLEAGSLSASSAPDRLIAWKLVLAGVRKALPRSESTRVFDPETSKAILASVVGVFPPSAPQTIGIAGSSWQGSTQRDARTSGLSLAEPLPTRSDREVVSGTFPGGVPRVSLRELRRRSDG